VVLGNLFPNQGEHPHGRLTIDANRKVVVHLFNAKILKIGKTIFSCRRKVVVFISTEQKDISETRFYRFEYEINRQFCRPFSLTLGHSVSCDRGLSGTPQRCEHPLIQDRTFAVVCGVELVGS